MARFLNTTGVTYHLEELIKSARERLLIISPYLKFNDRIRELLRDKDTMKIDTRIVYGKNEMAPSETNWLRSMEFIRTSFCQNLHAKCYLNETQAIITSMNLYEFSQQNNNEMGVLIDREVDNDLYRDTFEEAQRLIRISEQVRLIAEAVTEAGQDTPDADKLSSSKVAKELGVKTAEFLQLAADKGYLAAQGEGFELTPSGIQAGGEKRISKRFGQYFVWPANLARSLRS